MSIATLSSSERHTRPFSGTAGTMVAVLLLLAILPNAAVVASPMSLAILDSTLGEARVCQVQRERPNPAPGTPTRASWGALFGQSSPAAVERFIGHLNVLGRDVLLLCAATTDPAPGGSRLVVMVRGGVVCLPPPVVA